MVAAFFPIDQFQGASATGVFCAFAAPVGFQPLFHVRGDAGIKGPVSAAQDI